MARTSTRVTALITRNHWALLIHRFNNGDEYWVTPGGGMEEGEKPETALAREVREETGQNLKKFRLLATLTHEDGRIYPVYLCELDSYLDINFADGPEKKAQSPDNVFILEWVNLGSLPESIYPDGVRGLLLKPDNI